MKKTLITGGSSGIGKSLVRKFAMGGHEVLFTYRTGKNAADELMSSLQDFRVKAFHWDATDIDSLHKLREATGPVDVLINNAGLGSATVKKWTDDAFEQDRLLMLANAVAPLWMCRAYLPEMKTDGGTVINIASVGGGITQFPGFSPADGMSKAALTFLTRQLAAELSHDPVDVFAVCPGATDTPMFGTSTLDDLNEHQKSELLKKLPAGRLIHPDEIAEIALFLCTPQAKVLRGSVLDASLGLGVNPGLLQK